VFERNLKFPFSMVVILIVLLFALQCSTNQTLHEEIQTMGVITSPFEFMKVWQALKGDTDLSAHSQVLRAVPPSDLPTGECSFQLV